MQWSNKEMSPRLLCSIETLSGKAACVCRMNTRERCADAVQQVHLLLPGTSPLTNPELEMFVPPKAKAECKSNMKLMRWSDELQARSSLPAPVGDTII